MGGGEAWMLIGEALNLQQQGIRKEQAWTSLQEPITQRATKAVQLAPKDRNVLFLATWLLAPFAKINGKTKRLVGDYQRRLDRLGGPTDDAVEMIGGPKVYKHHRNLVKEVSSRWR